MAAPAVLGTNYVAAQNQTSTDGLQNFQGVSVSGGKNQEFTCIDGKHITLHQVSLSASRNSQTTETWTGSFSIQGIDGGKKHGDITRGTASNGAFDLHGKIEGTDNLCKVGVAGNQTSVESTTKDITFSTGDCPGTDVTISQGGHSNRIKHVETHCKHSPP